MNSLGFAYELAYTRYYPEASAKISLDVAGDFFAKTWPELRPSVLSSLLSSITLLCFSHFFLDYEKIQGILRRILESYLNISVP